MTLKNIILALAMVEVCPFLEEAPERRSAIPRPNPDLDETDNTTGQRLASGKNTSTTANEERHSDWFASRNHVTQKK